jgi:hypothetical protein
MNANELPDPEPSIEPTNPPLSPTPAAESAGGTFGSSTTSTAVSGSPFSGLSATPATTEAALLEQRIASLWQEEQRLKQDISSLQSSQELLKGQISASQMAIARLIQEGLSELEQRRQTLQIAVEQLERRQERIKAEMRTSFAGVSQDLAIRVQGFKDYLVGSLQDLAATAEQLELMPKVQEQRRVPPPTEKRAEPEAPAPRFAQQSFQDESKQIRYLLDQYRMSPDYYGPPWQLRRTFEPVHAERVSTWFFSQGGRGAIRTMGSRLQNILIVSAAISILRKLHGDRLRTLVLADSPERLGEWRRGLQDCLGISRTDFGANEGVVLFETPEPLAQRADRLVKQKLLPLIIIDESEDDRISLSLLQFPLWLAIAADPSSPPLF